jgi:hypothetical protein
MEQTKRRRGRPTKIEVAQREAQANRPTRERLSGPRDILTVRGKDPKFFYYWVEDASEDGNNIFRFQRAGYQLCSTNENLDVSKNLHFSSHNAGSIYRIPASKFGNTYLYLMRKPMEWYLEDKKAEEAEIEAAEKDATRTKREEGEYGEVTTRTKFYNPEDLD